MNWFEIRGYMERHWDLQREVERERLARQALAGQTRRQRFYNRALVWLGGRLVVWGRRLQASADTAAENPRLQLADHGRGAC
jgi:hypothetical protein